MLSSESKSVSARVFASSDSGRSEEDERTDRTLRILDARPGANDCVGDQLDGFVLADHALVQDLVEFQEFLALALDEAGDRNPRPAGDDLSDFVFRDLLPEQAVSVLSIVELGLFLGELLLERRQLAVS